MSLKGKFIGGSGMVFLVNYINIVILFFFVSMVIVFGFVEGDYYEKEWKYVNCGKVER